MPLSSKPSRLTWYHLAFVTMLLSGLDTVPGLLLLLLVLVRLLSHTFCFADPSRPLVSSADVCTMYICIRCGHIRGHGSREHRSSRFRQRCFKATLIFGYKICTSTMALLCVLRLMSCRSLSQRCGKTSMDIVQRLSPRASNSTVPTSTEIHLAYYGQTMSPTLANERQSVTPSVTEPSKSKSSCSKAT